MLDYDKMSDILVLDVGPAVQRLTVGIENTLPGAHPAHRNVLVENVTEYVIARVSNSLLMEHNAQYDACEQAIMLADEWFPNYEIEGSPGDIFLDCVIAFSAELTQALSTYGFYQGRLFLYRFHQLQDFNTIYFKKLDQSQVKQYIAPLENAIDASQYHSPL